jgi:hypothetical protein
MLNEKENACVIPVDDLIARGDYEHEFTLH